MAHRFGSGWPGNGDFRSKDRKDDVGVLLLQLAEDVEQLLYERQEALT